MKSLYNILSQSKLSYTDMLVQRDNMSIFHNIVAETSAWLYLAAYITLPGTFASFESSATAHNIASQSYTGLKLYAAVQNISLLIIATILCFIATICTCYLWYIWRQNFVLLSYNIFR